MSAIVANNDAAFIQAKASEIPVKMTQALVLGLNKKQSFAELAATHPFDMETTLSQADAKTKELFQKLFAAATEYITQKSPPLVTTLDRIGKETNNEKAAGNFLGYFVYREIQNRS